MVRTIPDDARGNAVEALRGAGLRVTGPRLGVLSALAHRPHSDTDTVIRAVRHDLGSVSDQAVYNVLAALVEVGLVRRIEPAGSPARFEARVADNHQVFAITHLPQIAARAHHHMVVQKGARGGVTTADVTAVVGDARVTEIARMLGGDPESDVSRAHARELLDSAVTSSRADPASRSRKAGRRGE